MFSCTSWLIGQWVDEPTLTGGESNACSHVFQRPTSSALIVCIGSEAAVEPGAYWDWKGTHTDDRNRPDRVIWHGFLWFFLIRRRHPVEKLLVLAEVIVAKRAIDLSHEILVLIIGAPIASSPSAAYLVSQMPF